MLYLPCNTLPNQHPFGQGGFQVGAAHADAASRGFPASLTVKVQACNFDDYVEYKNRRRLRPNIHQGACESFDFFPDDGSCFLRQHNHIEHQF